MLGLPGGSVVKNMPDNEGDMVWSLGWEDPPGQEVTTYSRILAWKIPWTEEPGGIQSMGGKELDITEHSSAQHSKRACKAIS